MLESVLLPAPFSPSSACTSPAAASKSTRSFATTPGKRLLIPRIDTAGVAVNEAASTGTATAQAGSSSASPTGARALQGKSIQRSVRRQTYSQWIDERGFS